jgi:hypothetical protein
MTAAKTAEAAAAAAVTAANVTAILGRSVYAAKKMQ